MIVSPSNLTTDDVTAGQRLPPLEVNVTPRTVVMGASASRDWQPQHHDHAWAVERAGTRDIFLNTPNQAGWIERYLTDWTGPFGRLGRLKFRMRTPVFPGDRLVFNGTVGEVHRDESGCTWVDLDVVLTVNGETVTECSARVAVPTDRQGNPWQLGPDQWQP
jgi:acyl dehydratase